ncbi:hypothetical protein [Streptomyces capparidis]
MLISKLKKRLSAAAAIFALAAGVGVLQPASAQANEAAPVYWTFENRLAPSTSTMCLTSGQLNGGTAKVFMSRCTGSNFQQWDWRGSDGTIHPTLQLQNKATGLCLATDSKSWYENAVWTSRCEWRDGMRFHYDGELGYIMSELKHPNVFLHVDRDSVAVYSSVESGYGASSWVGYHS